MCNLKNNGDNNYLNEKGGMSFGVRKKFMIDEENEGVVPMTVAPMTADESMTMQIHNQMKKLQLKYQAPDIRTLYEHATLTNQMKKVLNLYVDKTKLNQELAEAWNHHDIDNF